MIEITRYEAEWLIDLIEITFFDMIRNDPEIDNMEWVVNIISIYKKCKEGCEDE